MLDKNSTLVCAKCHRVLKVNYFYRTHDLEKYPLGYLDMCKECLTMHVNNWDTSTFLPILEKVDVPWVPDEWNKLLSMYGRDASKINGTTILGRYLAKMQLKQYKDYRWKDNEFLRQQAENRIRQAMEAQGFSPAEIAAQIETATFPVPSPDTPLAPPDYDVPERPAGQFWTTPPPPPPPPAEPVVSVQQHDDIPEEHYDLTDEDRTYLCLKWGRSYSEAEWVRLENLYKEMMQSYEIETASHEDTLKLMCKTSLKANQLLDMNDVEGSQKMLRMYDTLLKAGKFAAAQTKDTDGEFITSVSELVSLCETEGFIPRYYTDGPQDKVDETIADIKGYLKTLVTEEMNLGNLIDTAVQQLAQSEQAAEDEDIEDEDEDNLTVEAIDAITDEDISDFLEFKESGGEEDEES